MAERVYRWTEVADHLRGRIASDDLVTGALLPSESELSRAHGVSRVTVRKALDVLRTEGLVESRQGFGWIVGADPVRQSLDRLGTIDQQLAATGRKSEWKVLRFGFIEPPPAAAVLAAQHAANQVLEVARLNLADGEPFALVTVWCRADAGAGLSRNDVTSSTFNDLLQSQIGGATQVIGATEADEEAAGVLDVAEGSPLLRVRRTTDDTSGETLLVSEHLYPADRTEFAVTLPAATSVEVQPGLRLLQG